MRQLLERVQKSIVLPVGWKRKHPPRSAVRKALQATFDAILDDALHGKPVRIPGFGEFHTTYRKPHHIKDIQTGADRELPGQLMVTFKPWRGAKR